MQLENGLGVFFARFRQLPLWTRTSSPNPMPTARHSYAFSGLIQDVGKLDEARLWDGFPNATSLHQSRLAVSLDC